MGWAVRMGAAVALVWSTTSVAWSADAPLGLLSVEVRRGPESLAVVVQTDRPCRPPVSVIRTPAGALRRIYVDFPAGTTIARNMRRVVPGMASIRRVGVGLAAEGVVRVVVDVAGASTFAIRRPPAGHGLALVVTAHAGNGSDAARGDPTDGTAEAPSRRPLRVVLDPGHGGDDPGASGVVEEKAVTLAIARQLAQLLRSGIDAEVTLTREADRSVSLEDRTRRANAARGDLFVSIHANASRRRSARGVETYYLDNTEDQATLRLAAIENGRSGAGGRTSLDYILSSLVQGGKQEPSARLASHVQSGLVRRLRSEWRNVVDLGVKRGPFYVLVGAYMPCVLVETSFVTHGEEGRRLAEPTYQRAVAEGIYRGIVRFAETRGSVGTL